MKKTITSVLVFLGIFLMPLLIILVIRITNPGFEPDPSGLWVSYAMSSIIGLIVALLVSED